MHKPVNHYYLLKLLLNFRLRVLSRKVLARSKTNWLRICHGLHDSLSHYSFSLLSEITVHESVNQDWSSNTIRTQILNYLIKDNFKKKGKKYSSNHLH